MKFLQLFLFIIFASANLFSTNSDDIAEVASVFAEKTNHFAGSPTSSPQGSPSKKKENIAHGAKFRKSPVKNLYTTSHEPKESSTNRRLFPDHGSNTSSNTSSSKSSNTSSSTQETLVLFVTAPHDQPNRGDTDYVQSVMRAIASSKTPSIKTIYIKDNCQLNGKKLYNVDDLYSSNNSSKLPAYQIETNETRKEAVNNIIKYIEKIKKSSTILHLQLRAPETGCIFFESDLNTLKSKVDKLVITCHEWTHGHNDFRKQQMAFFQKADHVILLNQRDQLKAIEASKELTDSSCSTSSTSEKESPKKTWALDMHCSYSNITQTVCTDIKDKADSTSPNILVFGLIRPKKGFEEAIELAKAIKMLDASHPLHNARIKIAGKPNDSKLLENIICAKFNFAEDDKKEFKTYLDDHIKTSSTRNRIDLFLSCFSEQNSNLSPERINPIREKLKINPDISQFKTHGSKSPEKKAYETIKNCQPSAQEREQFHINGLFAWFKNNKDKYMEALPIDLYFNVDNEKLDELAQECKFCLKIEKKGFANNSSSIINALHRLLIVFTNQGELTSADFLENGIYSNAIVLVDISDKNTMISKIIDKMANIENDSSEFENRISAIKSCIENLFSDKKVANDHLEIYQKLLQQ